MCTGTERISCQHLRRVLVCLLQTPPLELGKAEAEAGRFVGLVSIDHLLVEGFGLGKPGLAHLPVSLLQQPAPRLCEA